MVLLLLVPVVGLGFAAATDQGDSPVLNSTDDEGGANTSPAMVCTHGRQSATENDQWYNRTQQAVTNDATDSNDVMMAESDVPGGTTLGNREILIGAPARFQRIVFDIGQPAASADDGQVAFSLVDDTSSTPAAFGDETTQFHTGGIQVVKLFSSAPNSWPAGGSGNAQCPGTMYWVRIQTTTKYDNPPAVKRISIAMYNLRVKVMDELGGPASGLKKTDFNLDGDISDHYHIFALREPGGQSGVYELALWSQHYVSGGETYSPRFYVTATREGMANSLRLDTGELGRFMEDKVASPLTIRYALKVIVRDVDGNPIEGATVKYLDRPPDATSGNSYYFKRPVSTGAISVSAPGFESLNTNEDRAASEVTAGTTAPTVITLSGSVACDTGTADAGQSVTCRGLRKATGPGATNGSGGTATTPRPPSSSTGVSGSSGKVSSTKFQSGGILPQPYVWVTPVPRPEASGSQVVYEATLPPLKEDQSVVQLNFTSPGDLFLRKLQLTLGSSRDATNVRVHIFNELDNGRPQLPPGGRLLARLTYDLTSAGSGPAPSVQGTTMLFNVSRSELQLRGHSPAGVGVIRYDDAGQTPASPALVSKDEAAYTYAVATEGPGSYAAYSNTAPSGGFWAGWWILLGVAFLGSIGVVVRLLGKTRRAPTAPDPPEGEDGGWEPVGPDEPFQYAPTVPVPDDGGQPPG